MWTRRLAGYGPASAGTFTSGATEATLTALLPARAAWQPDAWSADVRGPLPVIVHGEHTHYAVSRAVGVLGLGTATCVSVSARNWRLDPLALAATLEGLYREGRPVIAVVATAGHTATGSFDDLESIAAVCDRFDAWLHVDGAHGAWRGTRTR